VVLILPSSESPGWECRCPKGTGYGRINGYRKLGRKLCDGVAALAKKIKPSRPRKHLGRILALLFLSLGGAGRASEASYRKVSVRLIPSGGDPQTYSSAARPLQTALAEKYTLPLGLSSATAHCTRSSTSLNIGHRIYRRRATATSQLFHGLWLVDGTGK